MVLLIWVLRVLCWNEHSHLLLVAYSVGICEVLSLLLTKVFSFFIPRTQPNFLPDFLKIKYYHVIDFHQRKVGRSDDSLFCIVIKAYLCFSVPLPFCLAGMETTPSSLRGYLLKIITPGLGRGLLDSKSSQKEIQCRGRA